MKFQQNGFWFSLLLLTGLSCWWVGCGEEQEQISDENTLILCTDSLDNDKDGATDCGDRDCASFCLEICGDGKDNDQDGDTDCQDADCAQACAEDCYDGKDNDQDGDTDCQDADCAQACAEDCYDGKDNDQDGDTDCQDADCAQACVEDCHDGKDNDQDSLTDCQDAEDCPERCLEKCEEHKDEDLDGLTDCDDPDCIDDQACPSKPNCEDNTGCQAGERCIQNVCRSMTGHLLCSSPEKALVLVDWRLYEKIYWPMYRYLEAACQRRHFGIRILGIEGLDELTFVQVRDLVTQQYQNNPQLEGILFVGNIAMPTFFMGRNDTPFVRFWPRYYQDLDMVINNEQTIPEGLNLPKCTAGPTGEDGFPENWPCFLPEWFMAPLTVPKHDFDDFRQGPNYGAELWTAFLPVGFPDPGMNTYDDWAGQLIPFFEKALYFYQHRKEFAPNFYHVGNDPNAMMDMGRYWNSFGPGSIDYYSVNVWGEGYCIDNPECYQRAPIENYSSLEEFLKYAMSLPWMDEGWQSPEIFLSHLNTHPNFPRMTVYWVVHSTPTESIITTTEARTLIEPGHGGVLALLSGCLVGTYTQPGRLVPSDRYGVPYPERNILVSLVYGPSSFISAVGSIIPRTSHPTYGTLVDGVYFDDYLGIADKRRSDIQDQALDNPYGYRQHWEILIGDPFMDARY